MAKAEATVVDRLSAELGTMESELTHLQDEHRKQVEARQAAEMGPTLALEGKVEAQKARIAAERKEEAARRVGALEDEALRLARQAEDTAAKAVGIAKEAGAKIAEAESIVRQHGVARRYFRLRCGGGVVETPDGTLFKVVTIMPK